MGEHYGRYVEGVILADNSSDHLFILQPRYVVLGTGSPLKVQNDQPPQTDSLGRGAAARKGLKSTSSRPSLVDVSQPEPQGRRLYITIYKAKVRPGCPELASMSNFCREISNFYSNIQCPHSSRATFAQSSTENRALPCRLFCLN